MSVDDEVHTRARAYSFLSINMPLMVSAMGKDFLQYSSFVICRLYENRNVLSASTTQMLMIRAILVR